MHIYFLIILSAFICSFTTANEYVTGFRTRNSRRSALRDENWPIHSVRHSEDLAPQFGLDDFSKIATAGQKQFTKIASDGQQQFTKLAAGGQQQISQGVEPAQKNMLKLWETYSSGIKEMTDKMKTVMGSFGVPKDYFNTPTKGESDTVSKFLASEESAEQVKVAHSRFPFSDSD